MKRDLSIDSKARREDILQVAAEIFSEKGYRAATLNDVADAMGFTRAALYYYFKNKQEILSELFEIAGERLVARLNEHLAAEIDIPEKVHRILLHHTRAFIEGPHLFTVFQSEVTELPAAARKRLISGQRDYVDSIARLIEQGMDEEVFVHRPPKPTTLALLGMANSVSQWYRTGRGLTPDQAAELIVNLCLAALRTPDA